MTGVAFSNVDDCAGGGAEVYVSLTSGCACVVLSSVLVAVLMFVGGRLVSNPGGTLGVDDRSFSARSPRSLSFGKAEPDRLCKDETWDWNGEDPV